MTSSQAAPAPTAWWGGPEGDTFFGQEGADTFVIRGGVNWVMDLDDADRLAIGMTLPQVQAAATQLGAHLHIELAGGGDLYLASTTLAEVEADHLRPPDCLTARGGLVIGLGGAAPSQGAVTPG